MTVWNRDEAEAYLLRRINYETQPAAERAHSFRLKSMIELVERLGHPERSAPAIHIAGTKGKGSTSTVIASVLRAAGIRTGLYTSPHLERIEERIVIDGSPIPPADFAASVAEAAAAVETIDRELAAGSLEGSPPTYFDILTAAAWCRFRASRVEAAVIETGLGGRLDSTNVVSPAVTVITSISLDHTRQLGNTTAEIAAEKAGIIKPGIPVISGVDDPDAAAVIARTADAKQSPLLRLGRDFRAENVRLDGGSKVAMNAHREGFFGLPVYRFDWVGKVPTGQTGAREVVISDLRAPLPGRHQVANSSLAIMASLLFRADLVERTGEVMRRGLEQVELPGRIEIVGQRPTVIVDVAHNVAAMRALVAALAEVPRSGERQLVLAVSDDKDVAGILAEGIEAFDRFRLTRFLRNPRAVPPEQLAPMVHEAARRIGRPLADDRVSVHPDPVEAWAAACRTAAGNDLICVSGSTFLVAELRPLIRATNESPQGG